MLTNDTDQLIVKGTRRRNRNLISSTLALLRSDTWLRREVETVDLDKNPAHRGGTEKEGLNMKLNRIELFRSCSRALVLFSSAFLMAGSGIAASLALHLSPNVYATGAGGQITLRGSFTTADATTFSYVLIDSLYGLSPASPHLGIVAGSVLSSTNYNPPVNGVSFGDSFTGGGYLGPTTVNGPGATGITDLRTFVIPAGTPPGTYQYSYGVGFSPNGLNDLTLTIIVTGVDLSSGIVNRLFAGTPGSCPTSWICAGSPDPGFASYAPTTAQYPGGSPFATSAFSPTVYGGSGVIRQLTPLTWVGGSTYTFNLWAGLPNKEPDGTTPVAGWPQAPNGAARLYLTMGNGFGQVAAFDIPSPSPGTFVANPITFTLPSNSGAIGQKIGVMIFVSAPSLFSANFAITPVTPAVLPVSQDTHIRTDLDARRNDNYGCSQALTVGTSRGGGGIPNGGPDAMRTLLYFDFSHLPAHQTIKKAVLKMTISNYNALPLNEVYTIGVYRVIESGARTPWVEGIGAEAFPIPAGCTDVDSSPGVAWQGNPGQGGTDQPAFDPAAQAQTVFAQAASPSLTVISWDITALAEKWRTGEYPNYGMFLRDLTSPNQAFRQVYFFSRETPLHSADAPRLELTFGPTQ